MLKRSFSVRSKIFKSKKRFFCSCINIKKVINNLIVFCLIFVMIFSDFSFAKEINNDLFISSDSEALEIESDDISISDEYYDE